LAHEHCALDQQTLLSRIDQHDTTIEPEHPFLMRQPELFGRPQPYLLIMLMMYTKSPIYFRRLDCRNRPNFIIIDFYLHSYRKRPKLITAYCPSVWLWFLYKSKVI